jgi:hypothetical protein
VPAPAADSTGVIQPNAALFFAVAQGLDDATAIWWDPKATGPDEIRKQGTGMYQFVDGGKRYLAGAWPTEEKLFNPAGAVAIYDSPPPGEAPPTYPSPAK